MAATGLLALPHEMLARIKSHIHSLADHVHFSLTCRTLKDLYDDKFWKFACMSAGWGLLQTTAKTTKAIEKSKFADKAELWGGLARLVVKDADRFETFEDVKGWTTEDTIFKANMGKESIYTAKTPQEVEKEKIKPKCARSWPNYEQPSKGKKGVFTVPSYSTDEFPGPVLLEHPYLSNRLFCTPPITEALISCDKTDEQTWAKNGNGVTVHDAYTTVTKQLSKVPKRYWDNTDHVFWEGFETYGTKCYFAGSWGS